MNTSKARGIWELRPIKECLDITGKKPVSARWVDKNKRRPSSVVMRSRMVAKEFKGGDKNREAGKDKTRRSG